MPHRYIRFILLEKLPKMRGIALGVMDSFIFASHSFTMQNGDTILLYTDGINEAMNPEGELFGEERLAEVIRNHSHAGAAGLTNGLINAVRAFAGRAEQSDDITVLALRYKAAPAGDTRWRKVAVDHFTLPAVMALAPAPVPGEKHFF